MCKNLDLHFWVGWQVEWIRNEGNINSTGVNGGSLNTVDSQEMGFFVLVGVTLLFHDTPSGSEEVNPPWPSFTPVSERRALSLWYFFVSQGEIFHAEVSTNWSLLHNSCRSGHKTGSLGSSLAFQIVSDHWHDLMELLLIHQQHWWTEDGCVFPMLSVSGT